MKIKKIELRQLKIPLKNPFSVSKYTFKHIVPIIIKIETEEGLIGWGESPCLETPWYIPETYETTWLIMEKYMIPSFLHEEISSPQDFSNHVKWIQGNNLARAGLDAALWDIFAQMEGKSLSKYLGGIRNRVDAGVSEGIQKDPQRLINRIEQRVNEGYKRIKVKIKPSKDIEIVKLIRKNFPDIPLMVDANSAYTLMDTEHLQKLDQFQLMMIEQPLGNGDIFEHSKLQKQIQTPICLDESIHTFGDTQLAAELQACRIINVKPPRVGGPTEVLRIHKYCQKQGIPVWVGGMIETGIGRTLNATIASLPNFTLPGDLSPPSHILPKSIIKNPLTLNSDGTISVPNKIGLGIEVNLDVLEKYTIKKKEFTTS